MVLTEKLPSLDPFTKRLSSISGLIFFLWIKERKILTSSISQSLRGLRKVGVHPPSSLKWFYSSDTMASFCTAKENIEGNKEHNASSPHQIAFQNIILLPSLKEKAEFYRKRGHSLLISFHNPTPKPPLKLRVCQPPEDSPYLLLMTFLHRAFLSFANLQLHLHKRALFSLENFLRPRPPFFFYEQTKAHLTR